MRRRLAVFIMVLVDWAANTDSLSIGFCNEPLLGSKYTVCQEMQSLSRDSSSLTFRGRDRQGNWEEHTIKKSLLFASFPFLFILLQQRNSVCWQVPVNCKVRAYPTVSSNLHARHQKRIYPRLHVVA
jgi:hypothetical protein